MAIGLGFVLAAAVAVAVLVARSNGADRLVTHTFEVQQEAHNLLGELRTAENGQRGYVLTQNQEYLKPVDAAIAKVPGLVESLRKKTADNPSQQARLDRVEPLIGPRLDVVRRSIELTRQGDRDGAIALVATGRGKDLMEEITVEMQQFDREEKGLLAARQEEAKRLRTWLATLIGLALLAAMVLAGVLAVATRQAVTGLLDRTRELEAESKLRHEAEATLRQAVKMEAVGQLSGGIAHDFNNLLTIIIGNLDTMKRRLAELAKSNVAGDAIAKLETPLESAMKGAQSSAQLTQRLLAFSRRQALEPDRVDANRLISGMLEMLRRTLGSDISIETVLGAGLWPSFADAHQLENVLLNLALNAKAAMPDGGCLTIETANTYLDDAYVRRFGDVKAGNMWSSVSPTPGPESPRRSSTRCSIRSSPPSRRGRGLGLDLPWCMASSSNRTAMCASIARSAAAPR